MVRRAAFLIGLGIMLLSMVSGANAVVGSPLEQVKDTTNKLLAALTENEGAIKSDSLKLYALVDEIVFPYFDFNRMSRSVLGKHWRKATAVEKEEFIVEFRQLLKRTYATAMQDYAGQQIEYLPFRYEPGATEVVVKTEVQEDAGFPIPVDYKLYVKDDKWMVYGMSIDGVSMVINYRASFASAIRDKGSVAGLIKHLRERNKQALE